MKNYIHKSIRNTVDAYPNYTPFERLTEFLKERGKLTQQTYFQLLKLEFNPKNK